jgi:hypothetical protein
MVAAEREFLNTSSIIPQKIFKWKLFYVKNMSNAQTALRGSVSPLRRFRLS